MADQKRGKTVKKEQKNENIQVFVRVRPVSAQEKLEKCGRSATVVECSKEKEVVVRERSNSTLTKTFTFDRVFAPDSKQIDVYKHVVRPLIDEVLSGYNCTVFAYGQTGTGKTFTMEGERSSEEMTWEKDPQSGIVPRVLNNIFDELRLQGLEFTMGVSYLELYNEELIDLLSPVDDTTKLRLFEDANQKGTLVIQGLQEILVLDKKEVYDIMKKGSEKRQTAATMMNAQSSRSHTIFTVTVHIRESTEDGEELLRTGKINLVDLAGSENIGRSGAKQQRAREAGNINQSLLTLGRVITALVERTPHVPYRESKLTRLLQDSLGGRTKTSIIATVSPVLANIEETLSTLDYAHRAKSITNRPEINQRLTKKALLKEYTTEIERLRRDLEATRDGTGVFLAHDNYVQMMARLDNQDSELGENVQRIRALEEERDKKEAICDRLHMELEQKQQELYLSEERQEETHELLTKHMETEEVLGAQAATLLAVADQSNLDLQQVHDKLDRKRSVENQNFELVQNFQNNFSHRLARMKESSQAHSNEQTEQLNEIIKQLSSALQNIHSIEMAAASQISLFVESHGKKIQILEEELRSQAEARQQWSTEQIQAEREHVTAQISAVQAANVQTQAMMATLTDTVNQLRNSLYAPIQSLLQQVEHQSHVMQSLALQQVEHIDAMNQQVLLFSQQVGDTFHKQQTEITSLIQQEKISAEIEEERSILLNDILKSVQQLQEKESLQRDAQEVTSKHYNNLQTMIERQEMINKDSVASCEQQLGELDKLNNIVFQDHEKFTSGLKKSIKIIDSEMSQGFNTLVLSHQSAMSDIANMETMVEQGWQQHSETLEQQLRDYAEAAHVDLQAQATHLQALKVMGLQQAEDQSSFAEAREKALSEHIEASQRSLNDHNTATQEWSTQHNRELFERAQEVQAFFAQEMKCDQPTGHTPQRRTMDFPRELKATSPHERILERFRAVRPQERVLSKCQSVDSVLGNPDGSSTSRSTSVSSLSSPDNDSTSPVGWQGKC